jgi:hypothetical protein
MLEIDFQLCNWVFLLTHPLIEINMIQKTSRAFNELSLFTILLLITPMASATEPTTGTLIIISSIGGWIMLGLLPLVFHRIRMRQRSKSSETDITQD